jgi:hypothetical protein
MKKLLMLVAAAAGAVFVRNKMQQGKADNQLWAEATKPSDRDNAATTFPYGGTSN